MAVVHTAIVSAIGSAIKTPITGVLNKYRQNKYKRYKQYNLTPDS